MAVLKSISAAMIAALATGHVPGAANPGTRQTRIEALLEHQPQVDAECEHEIDTLRLILQGRLGTKDQRGLLQRILSQHKSPKNLAHRLASKLDMGTDSVRHSYGDLGHNPMNELQS